jgi:hypothetical protein
MMLFVTLLYRHTSYTDKGYIPDICKIRSWTNKIYVYTLIMNYVLYPFLSHQHLSFGRYMYMHTENKTGAEVQQTEVDFKIERTG